MKLNTVSPVEARHDQYHQEPAATTTTPGTEPALAPSKKLEFAVGVWSTVRSSSSSGDFKKPRWTTVLSPPKPGSPLPPHLQNHPTLRRPPHPPHLRPVSEAEVGRCLKALRLRSPQTPESPVIDQRFSVQVLSGTLVGGCRTSERWL